MNLLPLDVYGYFVDRELKSLFNNDLNLTFTK